MELSDYLAVIVPFNETEKKVYSDILLSCGLKEPLVVDVNQHKYRRGTELCLNKETLAKDVASTVGNRKSIIIGRNHSNIAFCYAKDTLVTFDSHNDSYPNDYKEFGGGYFLHKREGDTHILGSIIKSYLPRIKHHSPRKVDRIVNENLPKNIFLSLDIDAFNLSVTEAHGYTDTHHGILQDLARGFGYEFHLSFQKVLDISLQLTRGRNLLGINIAEYTPQKEGQPYVTSELLKTYLSIVLSQN